MNIDQRKPRDWASILIAFVSTDWSLSALILDLIYHQQGHELYDKMTNSEQDITWSSRVTCQLFVKRLIKKLQLQWPTGLPIVNDTTLPVIIDFSIHIMCKKAVKIKDDDHSDDPF